LWQEGFASTGAIMMLTGSSLKSLLAFKPFGKARHSRFEAVSLCQNVSREFR